jgi:hypothetical protein
MAVDEVREMKMHPVLSMYREKATVLVARMLVKRLVSDFQDHVELDVV